MNAVTDSSPESSPLPRWWVLACALAVVGVAADYVNPLSGFLGEASYLAVGWAAAAAGLAGALRLRGRARLIGWPIAFGLIESVVGDSIWEYLYLTRDTVPDVSVADVFYLLSYLGLAVGLFRMMAAGWRRSRTDGLIDIAAVLTMALVLQWHLVISDTVTDSSVPVTTRTIWALYPALDAVLLALVVRILIARRGGSRTSLLIAAGAGAWLVSDIGWIVVEGADDRWLNAGWLLGSLCLAASIWRIGADGHDDAPDADGERMGLGRVGVALLPLLVPGLIELVTYYQGSDPHPVPLLVASAILIGLAFLRTARILDAERSARRALESEKRYARALAVQSSDAVAVLGADARLTDDAPQLARLLGWPHANRGANLRMLVESADAVEIEALFARSLDAPGQVFTTEARITHAQGHEIWIEIRMVNRLDDPDVGGVVFNVHEVTDRKLIEEELTRQAFHDGLTGLANRVLFADRIAHALHRAVRTDDYPALVYLDLDGFKHVNDSLGHHAGDELLREVGRRLSEAVRGGDTVARLGGDEFAILIDQSPRPIDEASAVAERVLQALRIPVTVEDRPVTVSASIGIAIGDREASASTLLRDADIAMYQAKTSGRARWAVYDGDMRTAAVERLALESDLLGALDRDEMRVVYQPIVDLQTNELNGFEALVRWEHPQLGLLAPDRFLPIAEANGLIVPIGRWVLETATRTAADWQRQFPRSKPLSIAVNLSSRQLGDPDLVRYVAEALTRSGLKPSSLVLEMTETVLIEDPTTAAAKLEELHDLGIRLALDDFGTGYSSLSYLRQFKVDILKIDRSFIESINDAGKVPAIVRALLDLGRTLELETVAEGIEEDYQRAWLRAESCELGQGYLFARPLPVDEAELLVLQVTHGASDQVGRAASTPEA